MPKLSAHDVGILAATSGFNKTQIPIVVTIAYEESKFDPNAVGDQSLADPPGGKWGNSIGLMQIRSLQNPSAYSGADAMRIADKLSDPKYNMQVAYAIWKEKGGFGDWSTYSKRNDPGSTWLADFGQVSEHLTDGTWFGSAGSSVADTATGAVKSTTNALDSIGSLAAKVQDPQWWKRVGIGLSGYALILVGILFILVSSTQVRDAAKTAGGAAVGLIPGGGAVTTVAKGVAKTAAKGGAK